MALPIDRADLESLWLRNALAVVGGMFFTFSGFSFFVPFLALHLQDLGLSARESAQWAGYTGFVQGVGFAVSAPLWGMLADRIGRKPMVVRAMAASAIGLLLIPFVDSALAVLLIILIRGFVAGPGTAAVALVSAVTPRHRLAMVVGWIDAAQVLGVSFGLAAGGLLASAIGIQRTFIAGGCFGLLGALLVLLVARERFVRPQKLRAPAGQGLLRRLVGGMAQARATLNPTIIFAFLLSLGIWMSHQGIGLILPLRVQEIAKPDQVALYTGVAASIFAAAMFGGVLLAARLARICGYRQILFAAIIAVTVLFIPQGLTGELWPFLLARALQGFAAGLVMPLGRALIAFASDPADRGTVYGLSGAFSGFGTAIGPLLFGTLLTTTIGVGPAFVVGSLCLLPAFLALLRRGEINALAARG